MNSKNTIQILILLTLFIPIYNLYSQTGNITGTVKDQTTNEALAGANIIVNGTIYGAAAGSEGNFVIKNVPVGTYSITATVIGYKPETVTDIVINPAKPVVIDFLLDDTVIEFDALTVKPQYFTNYSNKITSTLGQSNEEIRRLPGGLEDVVRAISILPGVAQVQGGRNDLIVRGGAPSENLFIVDGIPVPNINHFGTQGSSGGPISFINLDFVKSTTFSSGGFGVNYGDKISSVLKIDLDKGRTDKIGGKATISASQFGFDLEGPINKNGSFLFSARRSYLDFIFKASGFGFVPEYWDFLSKVNYKIDKNNEISILGIAALDNTKFFNDTRENLVTNSQIMGSKQNQYIFGSTWKHILPRGFYTLTLSQNQVDFKYFQKDTTQQYILKNNSLERENSAIFNFNYFPKNSTEFNFGMQGQRVRFTTDFFLPDFTDYYGYTTSINRQYEKSATKAAFWAQVSQDIARLTLNLGVRSDYFSMIQKNWVTAARFSMSYKLSELTSIKTAIGRFYQSPSYIWVAADEINQQLKFIAANQYIFGISHLVTEDMQVNIEMYHKKYIDYPASLTRPYLVMANTGAGFGGSEEGFVSFGIDPLSPVGTGFSQGIEFFGQKKFSDSPVYGTWSINFSQTKFKSLDGIERPSNFDQRWIFNIGGGYVINPKWEVSARFRYATGRPYTPFNADISKTPKNYNTARIKDNHFLDIRIDKRWFLTKTTLITYIDIQNVYNRKAVNVPSYNAYTGEIEDRNSIGILPSVGISAEF